MKKLVFTTLIAVILTIPAFSQIKIQDETNNKTTKIASVRAGNVSLQHSANLGYYIVLSTSNRFDDPVLLGLGKDKDAASLSIASFMNMYDKADEYTADISDAFQQKIDIRKWGAPRKGTLTFTVRETVQAGIASIHRIEMVKLQKKFIQFCAEE